MCKRSWKSLQILIVVQVLKMLKKCFVLNFALTQQRTIDTAENEPYKMIVKSRKFSCQAILVFFVFRCGANLGLMYQRGDSVEQDSAKAAELYEKAHVKGYPKATYNLAVMYERGVGANLSFYEPEVRTIFCERTYSSLCFTIFSEFSGDDTLEHL